MTPIRTQSTAWQFARLSSMGFAAAILLGSSVAHAAISQSPMLARSAGGVKPNLMLTLDDSGSMVNQHMPEGPTKLGRAPGTVYTVNMPTSNWRMHPSDTYVDAYNYTTVSNVPDRRDAGATVAQKQMRSPDVNSIYYNPEIRYRPWPKPDGTGRYANAVANATILDPVEAPFRTTTVDLTTRGVSGGGALFSRALYYRLRKDTNGNLLDPSGGANYTQFDVNDPGVTTYTKHVARTDCIATAGVCTRAEELQNYANWFQFYRSRILLAKGGVSEAFFSLDDKIRVGWTTINTSVTSVDGIALPGVRQGVRDFNSAHKTAFLTWLQSETPSGGTPLRTAMKRIGDYYSSSNSRGPWSDNPASGRMAPDATCRRSYNILTTDGYYNDAFSLSPAANNYDSVNGPTYSGAQNPLNKPYTRYSATPPYRDNNSNSLADVAMYYWNRDLRPDLGNRVEPSGDDPAHWQHVTQFTVGLGVTGSLNPQFDLGALGTSTQAPTKSWPDINASDAARVDDLWHAALNSRGTYFSAKDATTLANGIAGSISKVVERERYEAGVATAGPELVVGNRKYVPSYKPGAWSGDLLAYDLSDKGVASTGAAWTASTRFAANAHLTRNIVTWSPADSAAVPFTATSLTAKGLLTQISPTANTALVDYLRGDTSNEGSTATYRQRESRLGDIVNSNPVAVQGSVNLGYRTLPTVGASYDAFVAWKKTRPVHVYVGGNDGMLHGFKDTKSDATNDGKEVFAFVPNAMLPNLAKPSKQDYGTASNPHQFFVDGPLQESDAFVMTPGTSGVKKWSNLLSGTYGAGGKGFYVLDVTNDAARPLGVNTVMLEVGPSAHASVGHMFAAPQIGMLPGGKWKAFIGNGYASTSGNASLLVVDLETRAVDKVITADSGTGNGLGGVQLIRNASQEVIGAYAGDLKGNLWRFDFIAAGSPTSSASTDWVVGFGGKPLFKAANSAGVAQPITAPPSTVAHVSGGTMVLVGTGKLFETGDDTNTNVQSMYGIWDTTVRNLPSTTVAPTTPSVVASDRSSLVQQTIGTQELTDAGTFYNISSNALNWSTHKGWYMDLTIASGQRSIYAPIVVDEFVYISTIVPAAPTAACDEATQGRGYNFLLPALTGGQFAKPVFDTDGNGVVNASDSAAAGFSSGADGTDAIVRGRKGELVDGSDNHSDELSIQTTTENKNAKVYCIHNCTPPCPPGDPTCVCVPTPTEPCGPRPPIPMRDRIWRQIINPPQPA